MAITKKITTLKDYLYFNDIKYQDFAKKCGMTKSMISNFCSGKIVPKYSTAKILSKATHDVVSPESILKFCFEKKLEKIIREGLEEK